MPKNTFQILQRFICPLVSQAVYLSKALDVFQQNWLTLKVSNTWMGHSSHSWCTKQCPWGKHMSSWGMRVSQRCPLRWIDKTFPAVKRWQSFRMRVGNMIQQDAMRLSENPESSQTQKQFSFILLPHSRSKEPPLILIAVMSKGRMLMRDGVKWEI